MYAIVETGGKQYRVKPGDTIAVERIAGEPGQVLDLGRVLLVIGNGEGARVGSPGVEGAVVRAEVVEHGRAEKIVVFRYKSKVRYRRKTGHRQALTRLLITDIVLDGKSNVAEQRPSVVSPPAEPVVVEVPEAEAEAPAPTRRRRAQPTPEEAETPVEPVEPQPVEPPATETTSEKSTSE